MLTLRPFSRRIGAGGLCKNSSHCHFHCAPGFGTPVLAQMLDSLVRVSRRGEENHFAHLSSRQRNQFSAGNHQGGQRQPQRPSRKQMGKCGVTNTGFLRFLFSNFRYSLTALSRGFASFPHGTCTLSVSHQYLAFDGIYHQIRAAIPNNSTLWYPLQASRHTGVSPSTLPRSRGLSPPAITERPADHNSTQVPIHKLGYWRFTRRYWTNPS